MAHGRAWDEVKEWQRRRWIDQWRVSGFSVRDFYAPAARPPQGGVRPGGPGRARRYRDAAGRGLTGARDREEAPFPRSTSPDPHEPGRGTRPRPG